MFRKLKTSAEIAGFILVLEFKLIFTRIKEEEKLPASFGPSYDPKEEGFKWETVIKILFILLIVSGFICITEAFYQI